MTRKEEECDEWQFVFSLVVRESKIPGGLLKKGICRWLALLYRCRSSPAGSRSGGRFDNNSMARILKRTNTASHSRCFGAFPLAYPGPWTASKEVPRTSQHTVEACPNRDWSVVVTSWYGVTTASAIGISLPPYKVTPLAS